MSSRDLELKASAPAILRKAASAISMVPTKGKITVLGRKSWNVLLHLAQDQAALEEKETFRAPLADVVAGFDFNSKNLQIIKTHLRSMMSTTVEWQSPTQGEGVRWDACSMLAHAAIYPQRGQAWVEWSYAPNIRAELLNPSIFGRCNLDVIADLRTVAGVALYEACARYKAVGRTGRNPWRWWAPVLLGRPDDERMQRLEYRIFKRDTLRPAMAEINAVSDLQVEMIEHKEGRFVSDLQFEVHPKRQHVARAISVPVRPVDMALIARATALEIEQDKFERLLDEYGEEVLTRGMEQVEKRAQSGFPTPLRDAYRYLKSVLESASSARGQEHHSESAEASDQVVDVPAARAMPTQPTQARGLMPAASAQEEARLAWVAERSRAIVAEIDALSVAEQKDLEQDLQQDLLSKGRHPTLRSRLEKSGWRHQLVRQLMVDFYASAKYGEGWNRPSADQLREVSPA